jgi:hypothetical protein
MHLKVQPGRQAMLHEAVPDNQTQRDQSPTCDRRSADQIDGEVAPPWRPSLDVAHCFTRPINFDRRNAPAGCWSAPDGPSESSVRSPVTQGYRHRTHRYQVGPIGLRGDDEDPTDLPNGHCVRNGNGTGTRSAVRSYRHTQSSHPDLSAPAPSRAKGLLRSARREPRRRAIGVSFQYRVCV